MSCFLLHLLSFSHTKTQPSLAIVAARLADPDSANHPSRSALHLEPPQKSSVRLDGLLHVRRERRVEEWAVSLRHFQQGLLELQRLGADRRDVVQRLPVELHVSSHLQL